MMLLFLSGIIEEVNLWLEAIASILLMCKSNAPAVLVGVLIGLSLGSKKDS